MSLHQRVLVVVLMLNAIWLELVPLTVTPLIYLGPKVVPLIRSKRVSAVLLALQIQVVSVSVEPLHTAK
jgi:hypothetical protein